MFDPKLFRSVFFLAAFAVVVSACAPVSKYPQISEKAAKAEREKQFQMAVRQLADNILRVHDIAYKTLKVNAPLCKETVRKGTGILPSNKYSFKKDYRKASEKELGLTDRVEVFGLAPGSAAARAGVRQGDILISLEGWTIPQGKEAIKTLVEKFLEATKKEKQNLDLIIERNGKTQTLSLSLDTVCAYSYGVTESPSVNAFADGKSIKIEAGMMRFVKNDVELATVIGHEIAHNLMGHIDKKTGNMVIGLVFDIIFAGLGVDTQGGFSRIGGQAYSQGFESEADYVGLYLTARAGYPIKDAPQLWRRMAVMSPGSIKSDYGSSHPATPERFLALEKTVLEINEKRTAGRPLIPDENVSSDSKSETDDSKSEIQ